MSSIGAASNVMPHAMTMKQPLGPPSGLPPAARSASNSDGDKAAGSAASVDSPTGKLLNLSA
jgi:hypothetical protein